MSESARFSNGTAEIIDLEETVCTPRFDCSNTRDGAGVFSDGDANEAYTDVVNQNVRRFSSRDDHSQRRKLR